jgi:hypothetical protein
MEETTARHNYYGRETIGGGEGRGAMALNLILIMPRSTGKWKLFSTVRDFAFPNFVLTSMLHN